LLKEKSLRKCGDAQNGSKQRPPSQSLLLEGRMANGLLLLLLVLLLLLHRADWRNVVHRAREKAAAARPAARHAARKAAPSPAAALSPSRGWPG
jgi:hypothetical protein